MTTTKRAKSFEEACAQTGKPQLKFLFWLLRFILKSKANWLYALYKMSVITEALNGDWKADWNDTKQKKFIPWFYNKASSGFAFYVTYCLRSTARAGDSSRICFCDSDTAEYAGRQFLSIWKVIIMG